jgi:hypothetical protein
MRALSKATNRIIIKQQHRKNMNTVVSTNVIRLIAHDTYLPTIQFQPPIIQFEPISQFVYCLPFWLRVQVSSVQIQCTMPEAERSETNGGS